ncbi:MAG: hypothetical protein M3285_02200 [Actinomycetota bacterium]|nr:hypothetical protein [Actinomycetota bacterium]
MILVGYRKEAHRTLEVARLEALSLNHNYIGTEHLLLAMTVADLGVASRVLAECGITEMGLKSQVVHELGAAQEGLTQRDAEALSALGIDLDQVRRRVEETFGAFALDTPPPCPTGTPFTDKAMRALHATPRHARRLGHRRVGPEHLLLALMDDSSALAVKLVRRLGTTPSDLRDRTVAAITST